VQAEFRDVFAHRLVPIQAPLVHQERQARGGERLGDRADQELRVGRHLQAGFDIAQAIGLEQRLHSSIACAIRRSSSGTNAVTGCDAIEKVLD
jgi:hypothetical protein